MHLPIAGVFVVDGLFAVAVWSAGTRSLARIKMARPD
jgi:hypothetical protein